MYPAKRALLGVLAFGLLLSLVLPAAIPARAQSSDPPIASMVINVQETPAYDVLGGSLAQVDVHVNATTLSNQSIPVKFVTNIRPAGIPVAFATVSGLDTPITVNSTHVLTYNYDLLVPANATNLSISIRGTMSGTSFLWRYLVGAPLVQVSGLIVGSPSSSVAVPSGTIISQVYGPRGAALPLGAVTPQRSGGGQVTYLVDPTVGLLVLQSTSYLPASIAITSVALAVVVLAALNLFAQGRQLLDNVVRQLGLANKGLGGTIRLGLSPGFKFRRLFQPKKLLALFILCSLVMVAPAAFGGPDPRTKAYVIAAADSVPNVRTNLDMVAGNVLVLTPSQDFADFDVMSSVGQFNIAIISNYPSAALSPISDYILRGLGDVPVIMVDKSADPIFVTQVDALYGDRVFHVTDATNLSIGEQQNLTSLLAASARTNILGLQVSVEGFQLLVAVEAILSMALLFLGWAYLGALTSESGAQSGLSHLVVLVGAGIFVFVFSETVYIVTSSLLAVPLSLHAVNSGAHDITAIGLLGFGGGSTPRLVAGFLGVIVGVLVVEGGPRIGKSDFALIGGLTLFLIANPLYIGQFVYQGILLFLPLGNFTFGDAYSSSLSIKGFIYGIGAALGGGINSTYLLSAGKILFFAGLVPLAYLKKMGPTTTAIALLLVAFAVGDGGVRVGEMTPAKTVIAVLPGLVTGFAFAALIMGLASIEKYVRGNWRSQA